jgi:hypothetical protein
LFYRELQKQTTRAWQSRMHCQANIDTAPQHW